MFAHLLSPLIAYFVTPLLTRRHNKRSVWVWIAIGATVSYAGPLALRILGLFPDNGHPIVFPSSRSCPSPQSRCFTSTESTAALTWLILRNSKGGLVEWGRVNALME